ncbi:MAG: hypothetical protein LBQ81_07165 [Zoogloeaceae bacterium]|jgi:hypothetical protein|nr:hypothetical protein [Zoogloeaceae bacterium]
MTKGAEAPLIADTGDLSSSPVWRVQRSSGTRLEAPCGNSFIISQLKRRAELKKYGHGLIRIRIKEARHSTDPPRAHEECFSVFQKNNTKNFLTTEKKN